MRYAAGIDVGGTFVKLALVSEDGNILFEDKLDISKATREEILNTIDLAIIKINIEANLFDVQISGIGIGSPGIVFEGVVLGGADNLNGWSNVPLADIFTEKFGLPVYVDNDANVMGIGEVVYGAAQNCTDVIFLTVGTGIGGAIFMNGQLYGGYKNRGTELGHIVLYHDGIDCNCGGRGCLEPYASTSALIRQYAKLSGKYEEKKVITAAFMLATMGALLFSFFPTFGVYLVSLFLIGVGMAILQVAINPLLRVSGGEENFAFTSVLAQLFFGGASYLSPLLY